MEKTLTADSRIFFGWKIGSVPDPFLALRVLVFLVFLVLSFKFQGVWQDFAYLLWMISWLVFISGSKHRFPKTLSIAWVFYLASWLSIFVTGSLADQLAAVSFLFLTVAVVTKSWEMFSKRMERQHE